MANSSDVTHLRQDKFLQEILIKTNKVFVSHNLIATCLRILREILLHE